ncbi:MAG: hypothetical protein JWO83_4049 [Caulobacteraceae bacterium]|nr:hypothetical protein [Caulobacteraceae bacterium]
MSWQASRWARDQRTGSFAAKGVLMVLAEAVGVEDASCILSVAALVDRTELSKRAVLDHLAALELSGLIQRTRRTDNFGHRPADMIKLAIGEPSLGAPDALREDNPKVRDLHLGAIPRCSSDPPKVQLTTSLGAGAAPPIDKGLLEGSLRVARNGGAPTRKTPIPEGFPDHEAIQREQAYLRAEGWNIDARMEAEKFRSRNLATDGRYVRWPAAFHTWIVNAIGYAPASAKLAPILASRREPSPADLWRPRVKAFADPSNQHWNHTDWGPAPGKPACAVPPSILAEFGFGGSAVVPFERKVVA